MFVLGNFFSKSSNLLSDFSVEFNLFKHRDQNVDLLVKVYSLLAESLRLDFFQTFKEKILNA